MWALWKERNARIFHNLSCSPQQIHDLILLRLCWWIRGWNDPFPYSCNEVLQNPLCLKGISLARTKPPTINALNVSWSPPSHLSLKWNTDASYDPLCNLSAIGGVLRNNMGNFICLFSSPIPPLEINSAEVYAIYRAIKITLSSPEISSHHIIFESDSANAVRWCNDKAGGPWNLNFMLNFIRHAISSQLNAQVIHKGRSSNAVADSLAKQGLRRENEFIAWL